jgi:transcription elongation factor
LEVLLLLIPRLPVPQDLSRFKSETFPIALFNYETAKQDYNIEPIRIHDNIYSFANDRFEHGLIVKSYSTHSVSEAISTMPLQSFLRFRESCHPRLTAFPRPSEWCFAEGDAVYIVDESYPAFHKSGIISTIRDHLAELDTDEGIICVGWLKICKVIHIGDFVKVTGGMHKGQSGWVEEVDLYYRLANIIKLVDKEKPQSDRCEVRLSSNE